jgi:hypothetical protein
MFWRSNSFRARNFTNLESCGFFLTEPAFSTAVVSGRKFRELVRGFAERLQDSRTGFAIQWPNHEQAQQKSHASEASISSVVSSILPRHDDRCPMQRGSGQ